MLGKVSFFAVYDFDTNHLKIENKNFLNENWSVILTKLEMSDEVLIKGYEIDGKVSHLIYNPYTNSYRVYKLAQHNFREFNHMHNLTFICNGEVSFNCQSKQAKLFYFDLLNFSKDIVILDGVKCPIFNIQKISEKKFAFCKSTGYRIPFASGKTRGKDMLYTVELGVEAPKK